MANIDIIKQILPMYKKGFYDYYYFRVKLNHGFVKEQLFTYLISSMFVNQEMY